MSTLKPIRTEQDYQRALCRIEDIFDAAPGTPEGDEAEVLTLLICHYEDQHHNILPPDPIEAIRFRLKQLGLNQEQAAKRLDVTSGRLSEFFNRKRKMPVSFLMKVKTRLGVPADCLLPNESPTSTRATKNKSSNPG